MCARILVSQAARGIRLERSVSNRRCVTAVLVCIAAVQSPHRWSELYNIPLRLLFGLWRCLCLWRFQLLIKCRSRGKHGTANSDNPIDSTRYMLNMYVLQVTDAWELAPPTRRLSSCERSLTSAMRSLPRTNAQSSDCADLSFASDGGERSVLVGTE